MMDPRDQARLFRLEHGGQNFGNNSFSSYGGGASAAPPAAQRNATNNGSFTSPGTYARQPGTNVNYGSPRRDPKSPATQEL